jgi:hypothetical protein
VRRNSNRQNVKSTDINEKSFPFIATIKITNIHLDDLRYFLDAIMFSARIEASLGEHLIVAKQGFNWLCPGFNLVSMLGFNLGQSIRKQSQQQLFEDLCLPFPAC